MIEYLQRLYQLRFTYEAPAARQRAQLLLMLSMVLIGLGVLVLVSLPIAALVGSSEISLSLLMLAVFVTGLMFVVQRLVQSGQHEAGAYLFSGMIALVYLSVFLAEPTATNPAVMGLIVPVLIVSFLIGHRVMLLTALILGGIVAAIIGFEIAADSYPQPPDERQFAIGVMFYFLSTLVLSLFVTSWALAGLSRSIQQSYRMQRLTQSIRIISHFVRSSTEFSLQDVVDLIRTEFDVYYVQLFLLEDSGRYILKAATGIAGQRAVTSDQSIDADGTTTSALAIQRKTSVLITIHDPQSQRGDFLAATSAELAVPLQQARLVSGLLVLQSENHDAFTRDSIDLVEILASELALAIQVRQQQAQVASYEQQTEDQRQKIEQYQRDLQHLSHSLEGQVWQDYLQSQETGVGLVWNRGIMAKSSALPPPDTQQPNLERLPDGRQRLSVPIMLSHQPLGEIVFEASAETAWSEQTLDLASAVSSRLALALDNARLFYQSQTIAAREQMIGTVVAELQDARDLELLLNRAATIFNRVLGAEQTHIRLGIAQPTSE